MYKGGFEKTTTNKCIGLMIFWYNLVFDDNFDWGYKLKIKSFLPEINGLADNDN